MKKLCLLLAVCLLASMLFTVPAFAETETEEDNTGEVFIVEDDGAETADLPEIAETEAFVPEGIEKAVFGKDDRIVVNPTKYPYSAIGMIYAKGKCGCSWQGSGFMVSKNIMLTAAHCLVCTDHSSWAKELTVYFGYKNKRNYTYKYNGKWTAWAGNLFMDKKYTTPNDWGIIKFGKNVGDKTGWFGTKVGLTKEHFEDVHLYYVAGYRDEVLRMAAGLDVRKSDDGFLAYQIDAVAGNSGGPVFDYDNYAVGIHIAEKMLSNVGYPLNSTIKKKWDEMK